MISTENEQLDVKKFDVDLYARKFKKQARKREEVKKRRDELTENTIFIISLTKTSLFFATKRRKSQKQ
jgi:hypothetical protein